MGGTDELFRTRCPACNVTYDVRRETPDDHAEGCAVREKLAWNGDRSQSHDGHDDHGGAGAGADPA